MKKNTLFILLCTAIIAGLALTPSSELQKLMDNPSKLEKLIKYQPPTNQIRNYQVRKGFCSKDDYKLPQKVALLSFYIKDEAYNIYSNTAYVSTRTTLKAGGDKVNAIAQRIYDQCIDSIKSRFSEMGMDLLEPHEFLSDKNAIETYVNHPMPVMDSKLAAWGLTGDQSATPKGFRLVPFHHIALVGNKYMNERDDYLLALGMDAYLTLSLEMSAAGRSLSKVTASIEYKNPAHGSKTVYRAYHENVWVNTDFEKPVDDIFIMEDKEVTTKKGKTKTESVPVDVDPNIAKLTTKIAHGSGYSLKLWIDDKK